MALRAYWVAVVVAAQQRGDRPPLVVAEVVDQQKRRLGVCVRYGEDLVAHEHVRHHGRRLRAAVDPVVVVAAHEFAEFLIGLGLLVGEHLLDALVGGVLQFDLPACQTAVDRTPVGEGVGHLQRGGDASEFRTVVGRRLLGYELLLVDVLFDRQEHLIGVHGFDEVVGDLRSDGLVHDVLLFALRYHDYGRRGAYLFDFRKRFEPRHAGHHLVEDNQVVGRLRGHVDGVVTVVAGVYLVSFPLQKENMGLEQLHFVVHPEYLYHSVPLVWWCKCTYYLT